MIIDWYAIAAIANSIICLFLGAWVNRWFESRPILVYYLGHVSAFRWQPPEQNQIEIYTHSVVLHNTGRKSATNVRLNHRLLPDFDIRPGVPIDIETLPDGSKDIVIEKFVPGDQITISYLYFPPVTWNQINTTIKSDEGFARPIKVLQQRQFSSWFNILVVGLTLAGLSSVIYAIYRIIVAVVR